MEHREDKAKFANALTKFRPRESPFVLGANLAAAGRSVRVMTRKHAEEKTLTEKARDARPPQRVGSFRLALGAPDPGASRRLCPSRYARALTNFVIEDNSR